MFCFREGFVRLVYSIAVVNLTCVSLGGHHSSSPESSYDAIFELVVYKRLKTDIRNDLVINIMKSKSGVVMILNFNQPAENKSAMFCAFCYGYLSTPVFTARLENCIW
jgi:hypothetical protein